MVSNCVPSLLAALYYRFGLPFVLQHAYCPLDRTLPKQLVYVALGWVNITIILPEAHDARSADCC